MIDIRQEITDEMIEESLARAYKAATPDILKDLRAELNLDIQPVVNEEPKKRQTVKARTYAYRVASCAAALIVMIGGYSMYNRVGPAFAVVGLDVNPGIEITIDKNEKVIAAEPVNKEGEEILSDMDLEKKNVNKACDEIVEELIDEGYLTETSNSVLLSVRAEDAEKGREIEKEVSDNLNGFLEDTAIEPAIFGQYVESDESLDTFAGTNGISIGKAWLIRKLTDTNDLRMTEDSLLGLSTQELVLLGRDKNVSTGTSYGTPDTSKYVGTDSALVAALEAAGLSREEARNVKVSFSCENGMIIYSVGFDANSCLYGFDVDAVTGQVMILDPAIPGVSAEEPIITADPQPQTAEPQNPSGSNDQNPSGGQDSSGVKHKDDESDNDPGDMTGDAKDIKDVDPADEPGDISGDVTDIEEPEDKPEVTEKTDDPAPEADKPEENKEGNKKEEENKDETSDK